MGIDAQSITMFLGETWATVYMTLISAVISYIIGIPLGVILVITDNDGIAPNKIIHSILGVIINIFRSIPFFIVRMFICQFIQF